MIPPTPGADPSSRLFGYATPPDGAGPLGPDQYWPQKLEVSREDMLHCLNPLQYVPMLGTIYRAVTGEQIPVPIRILGAGITGGPVGFMGAAFMALAEALFTMGPDLSRPSVPAGMSAVGGEVGVSPVTPGSLAEGQYTTLATALPEWLDPGVAYAGAERGRGAGVYQQASLEWQRGQAMEKGLA